MRVTGWWRDGHTLALALPANVQRVVILSRDLSFGELLGCVGEAQINGDPSLAKIRGSDSECHFARSGSTSDTFENCFKSSIITTGP